MKQILRLFAVSIAVFFWLCNTTDVKASTSSDQPTKYYTVDKTGTIANIMNGYGINLPTQICNNTKLKKIIIPKDIERLLSEDYYETDPSLMQYYSSLTPKCPELSTVSVSQNNMHFTCIDGVLYNKEKTVLYYCPPGKRGKLVVPEGVLSIGFMALQECAKLTSIKLPSTLQSIGEGAFGVNTSLKEITISKENKYFKSDSNVLFSKDGEVLVAYAGGKTNKSYVVPEGVRTISYTAFMGCTNLQELSSHENLITIGNEAFRNCTGLRKVNFKRGLRDLYGGTFYNCSNLTSLNLPDGTSHLNDEVLYGCSKLLKITLPKTIKLFSCNILDVPNRTVKIYNPYMSFYDLYNGKIADGITVYAYKNSITSKCLSKMEVSVKYLDKDFAPATKVVKAPTSAVKGSGKPDTDWYDQAKNTFEIANPDQLAGLAKLVSQSTDFQNKTIVLKKDLDLSCYPNWEPIGVGKATMSDEVVDESKSYAFDGSFDGGEHIIYNLRINRIDRSYQGLFGISNNPIINLRIKNAEVIGGNYVGILSGRSKGAITNCNVEGSVYGGEYVGGITGENVNFIQNCSADAIVHGITSVGGITGTCHGHITECSNNGSVIGNYNIGGIAGNAYEYNIKDCVNSMKVSGDFSVGGILGVNTYRADISYCTNKDNVTGIDKVGGIIGDYGFGEKSSYCTNQGKVTGVSNVGGIAGYLSVGIIEKCTNSGHISGTSTVGGILGTLGYVYPDYKRVSDCTNTGKVSGKHYTNKIIGKDILALQKP